MGNSLQSSVSPIRKLKHYEIQTTIVSLVQHISTFSLKRSKYELWWGYGSDGYLYDFVQKRPDPETEQETEPRPPIISRPVIWRHQRPRHDIWRAFGSDGYLYDFV